VIRARAPFAIAVSVMLGIVVASCASVSASRPSQVSAPVSPSASQVHGQTVPDVDRPKESRGIRACAVISSSQLTAMGLASATASDESNGNASACHWSSSDDSFDASVALSTIRDLRLFYQMRETFRAFEPDVVAGYPAVRTSPAGGGSCTILVGNADDQSFSIQVGGLSGPMRDWCSIAREVAAAVLMSLPSRS
jgi:hypothetical protein